MGNHEKPDCRPSLRARAGSCCSLRSTESGENRRGRRAALRRGLPDRPEMAALMLFRRAHGVNAKAIAWRQFNPTWCYDCAMHVEDDLEQSATKGQATGAGQPGDAHGPQSNADAPEAWLEEHGNYLFAYALSRVTDSHVAEDLVQETLLGAMQSHDRFKHGSSVRTWLTAILRHKLIDHLRRSKRHRGSGTGDRSPIDSYSDEAALERFAESQFHRHGKWRILPGRWGRASTDPASTLESEEFRRALLNCLEQLPPRPAEAIDLAERRGMSLEQVSKLLGITATHAGVLLHRARLALRRCLELNWFRDS
jgi:RNA polymerase sigma-70 factor (TIGR02943 family)